MSTILSKFQLAIKSLAGIELNTISKELTEGSLKITSHNLSVKVPKRLDIFHTKCELRGRYQIKFTMIRAEGVLYNSIHHGIYP